MCSLGIEPTTFALLTQCSSHWATGTLWEVYNHTACHSSPAISSSGVTRSSSNCALSTSRGSSIVRPTRSHGSSCPWDDLADHESIRGSSGGPVCFPRALPLPTVFFPDRGPPRHGRTGTQLASGFTQVCVSPSEPTRTDTVQAHGGRGAGPAGCAALAHPDPDSFPSRQHLPGAFLWGRTSSLRGSAPYGTRVQICGTSICGSWMGCSKFERSTTDSGRDHHSG